MIDDIWFKPYDFQNIAFENIDAVRLSGSRIFYSFIIEGKKEFLKMSCFIQSWETVSEFRAKYLVFGERTR